MEQNLHDPEVYDFRKYDRIWQRVAPGLEPYPTPRQEDSPPTAAQEQTMPAQSMDMALAPVQTQKPAAVRQESQLRGAERNPCCLGSAAAEMLEVLIGFIEEELQDQRYFLALSRQAPSWARQRLRDISSEEGAHARRLMAVYYLITGECYRPAISRDHICLNSWCAALRERYHDEACNGLNYARAAEGTTDPCLSRLLNELSADEYRHADSMVALLERSLRR